MSNKRNTRAGTSRVETLTALPTVLVLRKRENQFLKKSLKNSLPQEPVSQVSQVFIVVMFAGLDLAIKLHGSPFFLYIFAVHRKFFFFLAKKYDANSLFCLKPSQVSLKPSLKSLREFSLLKTLQPV